MNEANHSNKLRILLIGDYQKLSGLERALSSQQAAEIVGRTSSAESSFGFIPSSSTSDFDAVFIDPFADMFDPRISSDFILNLRATSPNVAFVLLVSTDELLQRRNEFNPELRSRIGHYYTLDPSAASDEIGPSLARAVEASLAWRDAPRPVSSTRHFEYDAAISFAGEDREFAGSLANVLTRRGVKVFFDDDYKARLWGEDLYTTLYDIYFYKARYCIIILSKAYRDKMWTVHERQAAQARALEMKGAAYILPVRLEEAEIQGIPLTVGYLQGDLGVEEIARILITKLSSDR